MAPVSQSAGRAIRRERRQFVWGPVSRCACGRVVRRIWFDRSCVPFRLRWPALHMLRIRHPELAGLVMRNEERAGLLVDYRHHRRTGFVIVAVSPRWQWVTRLIFYFGAGQ